MRKNQYNLHIRLDEDERAALEKGLQASGLPLSAYLRKLILGESIQAAPSEELRRLRFRLFLLRKKSASIAFWYQNAACRENPDPNATCGRRTNG